MAEQSYLLFGTADCGDGSTQPEFAICISSAVQRKLLPRGKLPHTVSKVVMAEIPCKELSIFVTKQLGERISCKKQNNSDGRIIAGLPAAEFQKIYEQIVNELSVVTNTEEYDDIPDYVLVKELVDLSNLQAGVNWIILSKKSPPVVIPADTM